MNDNPLKVRVVIASLGQPPVVSVFVSMSPLFPGQGGEYRWRVWYLSGQIYHGPWMYFLIFNPSKKTCLITFPDIVLEGRDTEMNEYTHTAS